MSLGWNRDRAPEALDRACTQGLADANDAIEVFEAIDLLSGAPGLYGEPLGRELAQKAEGLKGEACKVLRAALRESSLVGLYEDLYIHYRRHIWSHLCSYRLLDCIDGPDVTALLDARPNVLLDVLRSKPVVSRFDGEIAGWMKLNHRTSAEALLGLAERHERPVPLYLPDGLSNGDKNDIVEKYLRSPDPNLNFVTLLLHWPAGRIEGYFPSDDVRVLAKKVAPRLNERILAEGTTVRFGSSVYFEGLPGAVIACARSGVEDHGFVYDTRWLLKHLDPATVLGNYLYVFQFTSPRTGLLYVPSRENDEPLLYGLMGRKAMADYDEGPVFGHKSSVAVMVTKAYSELLRRNGVSLEHSLKWYFNEGIEEEFGVTGFYLHLPSGGTYLDRCRSIGSEIEGVVKAFKLFCEKGEIDHDYFELIQFKQFEAVPSLLDNKYAYAKGDGAKTAMQLLCSNQCELSFFNHGSAVSFDSFYDRMLRSEVRRRTFDGLFDESIDWLLAKGLICEGEQSVLLPTEQASVLEFIWREDAFPYYRAGASDKKAVNILVAQGLLEFETTLLARPESAYMDYVFNNSRFGNALALRNKYDHASGATQDPDAQGVEWDYITLLNLLIMLALKINEELCFHFDTGWASDFEDVD